MEEPNAIMGSPGGWAAAERTLCRLARPVVIEARGVEKSFRIPERRIDSLKERATHPFTRIEYRELRALRDVTFDVHEGEFFGIVGRNGSGKSTLLKILASIYRADGGRSGWPGRLAPFIELGVGFNTDLTARDNVVLNGVLMGLSTREARRRLDAVLDFAELRDFVEVELKNYSSGMMVRLAFAVMVQADADIMLIDEVLAVGDAAFAQKCMDVFHEKRAAGKTIVLVTHDMATIELLCHRALLLHDGELEYVGDPRETALRYHRFNFDRAPADGMTDINARVVRARLLDRSEAEVEALEQGEPIAIDTTLEAIRELGEPEFAFQLVNETAGCSDHALLAAPGSRQCPRAGAWICPAPSRTGSYPAATTWTAGCGASGPMAGSASRASGSCRSRSPGNPRRRGSCRSPPTSRRRWSWRRERSADAAARRAGPVGPRRRLAPLAGAAHPDRDDRLQEGLLRHGAGLPLVARPPADAVRRAAGRLHAGVQARLPGARTIRCCSCSTSCCSGSSRRPPAWR